MAKTPHKATTIVRVVQVREDVVWCACLPIAADLSEADVKLVVIMFRSKITNTFQKWYGLVIGLQLMQAITPRGSPKITPLQKHLPNLQFYTDMVIIPSSPNKQDSLLFPAYKGNNRRKLSDGVCWGLFTMINLSNARGIDHVERPRSIRAESASARCLHTVTHAMNALRVRGANSELITRVACVRRSDGRDNQSGNADFTRLEDWSEHLARAWWRGWYVTLVFLLHMTAGLRRAALIVCPQDCAGGSDSMYPSCSNRAGLKTWISITSAKIEVADKMLYAWYTYASLDDRWRQSRLRQGP